MPKSPLSRLKVTVRRSSQSLVRSSRRGGANRLRSAGRSVRGRKQPVHMLHIGKTGGTALKDALEPVRTAGRYEIRLHDHPTIFADVPEGERAFLVVRDPADRFVSAFNSRLREGRPRHELIWSPEERIAFGHFQSANELAEALSSVDGERRHDAFAAMTQILHVRDSYWRWFRHRKYLERRAGDLLLVQWFPDLNATFPRLRELLELPAEVCLPTDEVRAHRTPSGMERRLSELGARNIRWWFSQDYAFLDAVARLPCFAGPTWTSGTLADDGFAWPPPASAADAESVGRT